MKQNINISDRILSFVFSLVSVVWMLPVAVVFYNSFKNNDDIKTSLFSLPDSQSFAGLTNYVQGIVHGNYPFYFAILFSVIITVLSVALILICTSMTAWFINRVDSLTCKVFYYFCIFVYSKT